MYTAPDIEDIEEGRTNADSALRNRSKSLM